MLEVIMIIMLNNDVKIERFSNMTTCVVVKRELLNMSNNSLNIKCIKKRR